MSTEVDRVVRRCEALAARLESLCAAFEARLGVSDDSGEFVSAQEARALTGLGRDTLRRLADAKVIERRRLPSVRGIRYSRADLAKYSASIRG